MCSRDDDPTFYDDAERFALTFAETTPGDRTPRGPGSRLGLLPPGSPGRQIGGPRSPSRSLGQMSDTTEVKRTRAHKATYSRDKKKGGYLVRVAGPHAERFAGRDVPVTMLDGSEHAETLVRLIWTGVDTGEYGGKAGEPIALYTFAAKPREDATPDTF
jgi:hypothetical protein